MPGAWPEPFGLVAIEALACGTPVIARRIGALPEIIRDGVDGFFGDDVTQLAFKIDGVRGPRSSGDPRVGAGAVLGRADDRRLRGALRTDARGAGGTGRLPGGRATAPTSRHRSGRG